MNKEALKKEIDYEVNTKNNLWYALIVSISGTLSLVINPDSPIKIVLIGLGIFTSLLLLYGYFVKNKVIDKLLDKLNQGD